MHPLGGKNGTSPIAPLFLPAIPTRELLNACHLFANLPVPDTHQSWTFLTDHDPWIRKDMLHSSTFWCLSPQFAKQGFLCALQAWCENPWNSQHIMMVPRTLLRSYGRVSKFFYYDGQSWDLPVGFTATVPYVMFRLLPFDRPHNYAIHRKKLSSDKAALARIPRWIQKEILALRRLS